ncbi:MAG: DUF4440 domain-containing protein [Acidobacteriaceae bacterium]|nr:DUF4440 domain-containing protein [Acidobacteriaceae bacterium]
MLALLAVTRNYADSAQTSKAQTAAIEAIKANEEQWNKDFQTKNVDALLAHYAGDATLMSPGVPAALGKDAIRVVLTQMVSDPALSLKFQARRVEVSKAGDVAFTEGSYELTYTGPGPKPMQDKGSYVTTYRKLANGSWKAVSDIASSEVPPSVTSSQK